MSCHKCGQPSYCPELMRNIENPNGELSNMLCEAHWWQTQIERINRFFELLEQSSDEWPNDSTLDWYYTGIASLDPGAMPGRKRRIVRKSEPMAG